jgi:hypothetical protein
MDDFGAIIDNFGAVSFSSLAIVNSILKVEVRLRDNNRIIEVRTIVYFIGNIGRVLAGLFLKEQRITLLKT